MFFSFKRPIAFVAALALAATLLLAPAAVAADRPADEGGQELTIVDWIGGFFDWLISKAKPDWTMPNPAPEDPGQGDPPDNDNRPEDWGPPGNDGPPNEIGPGADPGGP